MAINLVFSKIWENAVRADGEYVPKVYPKAANTTICSCSDLVFAQCHFLDLQIKFSQHNSLTHRTHLWDFLSLSRSDWFASLGPVPQWQWRIPWCSSRVTHRVKNLSTPSVLGQLCARLVSQCSSFLRKNFQYIILKRSLKRYNNIYS